MSWMGKWDIRLYFSTQNMVFLPIKYSVANSVITLGNSNSVVSGADASISKNFCQVGMTCPWYAYVSNAVKAGVDGKNGVQVTKMTLNNVEMNTAQFQIRMDIMEMLKQKYMSENR